MSISAWLVGSSTAYVKPRILRSAAPAPASSFHGPSSLAECVLNAAWRNRPAVRSVRGGCVARPMLYIFVNCVTIVLFERDCVRAGMARREIDERPPQSHAEARVAVRTVFLLVLGVGMMNVPLGWERKWSIACRYVEGRETWE